MTERRNMTSRSRRSHGFCSSRRRYARIGRFMFIARPSSLFPAMNVPLGPNTVSCPRVRIAKIPPYPKNPIDSATPRAGIGFDPALARMRVRNVARRIFDTLMS